MNILSSSKSKIFPFLILLFAIKADNERGDSEERGAIIRVDYVLAQAKLPRLMPEKYGDNRCEFEIFRQKCTEIAFHYLKARDLI